MPETVLITGGGGFIGSFLVDALIRLGQFVIVYDNMEPQVHAGGPAETYLNSGAEYIYADIRDRDSLERAIKRSDVVLHQAALVGVGQSMYQIERYVDINTRGTAVLLDVLVNSPNNVRKVVVAASMSGYGEGRYQCARCGPVAPPLRSEEQLLRGEWELLCRTCGGLLEPLPSSDDQ